MPKILTNGNIYSIKLKIILISALVFVMVGLMTSGAFAEDTEEKFKITFDEGDYILEYTDIIVPIKLQVLDHDYKITPEYFVRSQGKTINHHVWSNINSGDFTSYLLLDKNYVCNDSFSMDSK